MQPAVLPAADIAALLPQALKAEPLKQAAAPDEDLGKPDDEKPVK